MRWPVSSPKKHPQSLKGPPTDTRNIFRSFLTLWKSQLHVNMIANMKCFVDRWFLFTLLPCHFQTHDWNAITVLYTTFSHQFLFTPLRRSVKIWYRIFNILTIFSSYVLLWYIIGDCNDIIWAGISRTNIFAAFYLCLSRLSAMRFSTRFH